VRERKRNSRGDERRESPLTSLAEHWQVVVRTAAYHHA
jgi:hypothetical protein